MTWRGAPIDASPITDRDGRTVGFWRLREFQAGRAHPGGVDVWTGSEHKYARPYRVYATPGEARDGLLSLRRRSEPAEITDWAQEMFGR